MAATLQTETVGGTKRGWLGRIWIPLSWIAAVGLLWGLDTLTKLAERERTGIGLNDFRLYAEQGTSALAVLLLIPAVAAWLALVPPERRAWFRFAAAQLLGTLLFACAHYVLIVALRILLFSSQGLSYRYQHAHLENLIFEYQKDIKIYLAIAAAITIYRYFAARSRPAVSDKLLVQTGSGERLVELIEVDYLKGARNYVSVFVSGHEYLLRETLANLERRLTGRNFLRVHRSVIVNVARMSELRPLGDGSYQLMLKDGTQLPLSRSYRDQVRDALSCRG